MARGGRRDSPGRQGAASAPGGRKRQRPSPAWAETACGLRWPKANRARPDRATRNRGCPWVRLAPSSRTEPRRTPQIGTTRYAPSRTGGSLAAKAGSGRVARTPEDVVDGPARCRGFRTHHPLPAGSVGPPAPRQGCAPGVAGRPGGLDPAPATLVGGSRDPRLWFAARRPRPDSQPIAALPACASRADRRARTPARSWSLRRARGTARKARAPRRGCAPSP